ncbi:SNF2 family N-terminal domain-containing protein [Daldinia caldariorum]|uniref:SNF2 family N-terminal domain-containing protein n=1 Tax=Daldinia caldariorum TaxID=326644 RepID=UPI00200877C4|nr:SNF2 family N-terminal domain-containing protein [Daldinia caldariorum]KAI1468455.1 SNF2 family N-terminal domain-containing protein [Daldinia caldariorum]
MDVMTESRDSDNEEGGIWVTIDVRLERQINRDLLQLTIHLNWNPATYLLRSSAQRDLSGRVLRSFFGSWTRGQERLAPLAFYDAAFVPEQVPTDLLPSSVPKLTATLFPFQRRALQWLLNREGVTWSNHCSNGEPGLEPLPPASTDDLPLSFIKAKDADGGLVYISNLYHIITRDVSAFRKSERALKGGILAEEMGLGKTVEIIALICMHKRDDNLLNLNNNMDENVQPSNATLIVAPNTLRRQWIAEFKKHAPELRVMEYEGLKGVSHNEQQLVSELVQQDVVITTYKVLQDEIHYAEDPPDRSMRHQRKYYRPKSPLTQISWWRVCLDEAQQIESGISQAAKVARLIPRINAWGVTGTPVKTDIKDLWGLLVFLRYEPFASSFKIWEGLISTGKELFYPLFSRISLRHTKRAVRDELTLPPQKRYVITMPFTTVEEEYYQTLFKDLATKIGVDERGSPLEDHPFWDAMNPQTLETMRSALSQLRKAILHPSLGSGNLRRTVEQKYKALQTIDEVLDAMVEKRESLIRTDQCHYLLSAVRRGQMLEYKTSFEGAITIWMDVVDEVEEIEEECRKRLQSQLERAKRAASVNVLMEGEDSDVEGEKDPEERRALKKVGECRRKLRSMLDIHHRAEFLIASGYYQMKADEKLIAPNSDAFKELEEIEASKYEKAKVIRQEILREAQSKALSRVTQIREKASSQSFIGVPEIKLPSYHGLDSRRVSDNFRLLAQVLGEQATLIDEWREAIIQMLIRPLVDEEGQGENTGEEYEDSTKTQDELMAYTLALRAVIADREDSLTGLENERVKYDTRLAERQAKDGEGHAPEKVLMLLQKRDKIRQDFQGTSFRSIITDLRELATKLRYDLSKGSNRARIELDIVERTLQLAQEQIGVQHKTAIALGRELDAFTRAMNARVEYYRQLQEISDSVAPLGEDPDRGDIKKWFDTNLGIEEYLREKVAAALPRYRYLVHLQEGGKDSEVICVICHSTIEIGVLTTCGHHFCKECIEAWFKRSRTCPVCKKQLLKEMLHDITQKKQKLRFHQEHPQGGDSQTSDGASTGSKSKEPGIYTRFSSQKLEAIQSINLNGPSFTTKIDTLAKHLMWLRVEDPGAKSVIFSQYSDFLETLGQAFSQYKIVYSSFKERQGINSFKENPDVECFLMDARAHASGLNLINASHVFLCEPLLNTALELQAIARVDRIGQKHETTVWLYLVEGTVEQNIYNISVQRRLEQLGQSAKGKEKEGEPDPEALDLNLEVANSRELEQASVSKLMCKDQSMGEVVHRHDVWECLFGHVARG